MKMKMKMMAVLRLLRSGYDIRVVTSILIVGPPALLNTHDFLVHLDYYLSFKQPIIVVTLIFVKKVPKAKSRVKPPKLVLPDGLRLSTSTNKDMKTFPDYYVLY